MILTNVFDLPAPLVEAIRNDPYDKGPADISVTGLLSPPRMLALYEKHSESLVVDVSDLIWQLLGKSVHTILERASPTDEDSIREARLFHEVDGWVVSGQFDHLSLRREEGKLVLSDYKVTSAYTMFNEGRHHEWECQLNLYAHLLRGCGYIVDEIQVVAILRDWQRSLVGNSTNYPQRAVQRVPLTLWPPEEAEEFLRRRVRMHQAAREVLPECSAEDRWAAPAKYAVFTKTKSGGRRARATKVFDDGDLAREFAAQVDGEVEYRPGDAWVRCKSYCLVAQFCTQYLEAGE